MPALRRRGEFVFVAVRGGGALIRIIAGDPIACDHVVSSAGRKLDRFWMSTFTLW